MYIILVQEIKNVKKGGSLVPVESLVEICGVIFSGRTESKGGHGRTLALHTRVQTRQEANSFARRSCKVIAITTFPLVWGLQDRLWSSTTDERILAVVRQHPSGFGNGRLGHDSFPLLVFLKEVW